MTPSNTLTRIEARLRMVEQTTEDEHTRQVIQSIIRQWRQGRVPTADWLKLQDETFINEILKRIPQDDSEPNIQRLLERK